MVKVSDPKKIELAIKLLPENSMEKTNELIKERFGSGLSNSTLTKLRKDLNVNPVIPLLREMYEFFVKNKDGIKYNDKDIEMLKNVKEVIENE